MTTPFPKHPIADGITDAYLVQPRTASFASMVKAFSSIDGLLFSLEQGEVDVESGVPVMRDWDGGWCERIGNAVPPAAAEAIANVMGTTLLLAWSGETFMLSAAPIWVRPVAVALSVSQGVAR